MAYPVVRGTSKLIEAKAKEGEIAWPAGSAEGDLAFLSVTSRLNGVVPTITTPEGWALLGSSTEFGLTTNKRKTYTFWRKAAAGTTSATKVKIVASAEATGLSAQMISFTAGTFSSAEKPFATQNTWSFGEQEEAEWFLGAITTHVPEELVLGMENSQVEIKPPATEAEGKKWVSQLAYVQFQANMATLEVPKAQTIANAIGKSKRVGTTAYENLAVVIAPMEAEVAPPLTMIV